MITWAELVDNLTKTLGRAPTFDELLEAASVHQMTPEEVESQRQSLIRGITKPCEHGEIDFEQCGQCRSNASDRHAQTSSKN